MKDMFADLLIDQLNANGKVKSKLAKLDDNDRKAVNKIIKRVGIGA